MGDEYDPKLYKASNNTDDDDNFDPKPHTARVLCEVFPAFLLDDTVVRGDVFCWDSEQNPNLAILSEDQVIIEVIIILLIID